MPEEGRYLSVPDEPDRSVGADQAREYAEIGAKADTLRAFTDMFNPGSLYDGRVERLTPGERKALVANLVRLLNASDPNAENGPNPEEWLEALQMLQYIDAATYAGLQKRGVAVTQNLLKAEAAAWKKTAEAFGKIADPAERGRERMRAFDLRLRRLFVLGTKAPNGAARDLVATRISEAETDMVSDLDAIREELRTVVEDTRKVVENFRKESGERAGEMRDDLRKMIAGGMLNDPNLTETGSGFVYRVRDGGMTTTAWNIELLEARGGGMVIFSRADRPSVFVAIDLKRFLELAENNRIGDLVKQAVWNAENERRPKELTDYELPRTGRIAHIRLCSADREGPDGIVNAALQGSAFRSVALRRMVGDRLLVPPPLITHDPVRDLGNALTANYAAGARHFVIDIFAHGTPARFEFPRRMTADQLVAVLRAQPEDATFDLSTIACFGGDLREGLIKALARPENVNLRRRIVAFIESKPYIENMPAYGADLLRNVLPGETASADRREYRGSIQYSLVTLNMLQGLGYGRSYIRMDEEIRKILPMDPEILFRGTLFTQAEKRRKDEASA